MIGHPNSPERVLLWNMMKSYKSFCGPTDSVVTYADAMSRAKIVINQPTEPWDNILNNRFFEALAFKSVLLQKRLKTTLIEDLGFGKGDFLYWDSLDQLIPMIDAILHNYKAFDKMRRKSNEKVQKYSMEQQLIKILDYVS
jgi:hypothetical protein